MKFLAVCIVKPMLQKNFIVKVWLKMFLTNLIAGYAKSVASL